MKVLKKILIVLVVLILVIAVVGFFFPSKVHVERSISIHAQPEVVYNYVSDLRLMNQWSPWYELDTAAKQTFEGPPTGVGSTMSWESDNYKVGKGSMKITEAVPNEMIKLDLIFGGEPSATSFHKFEAEGGGTKHTWGMDGDMGANPFKRLMGGLMMNKMVGEFYAKGLSKIKENVESMPPPPTAITLPADSATAK